ncbi:MAG TPA: helix-turn-helix transcriptional regulator [Burkholderiaceae bacterium]
MNRDEASTSSTCGAAEPVAGNRLLAALMDRIECGVAACLADGELLHANLAARRELAETRTLRVEEGRLQCEAAWREDWIAALRNAASRHRTSLVVLGTGEDRITVATMPLALDLDGPPAIVVVMGRRSPCSTLGMEMLASSHGLTYAESRVLRALVDSRTPREIAATHGVAVATVRTQIQSVRDKLGVRSIDALLLRAAEMPPLSARQ